ncbi:MAG: lytic transglycosylase domain-containing protein [Alphaproteobacteria bacterium]|nr:lytic transglycosylase domain-containing protein [Alphaproteobacteria bacterium]
MARIARGALTALMVLAGAGGIAAPAFGEANIASPTAPMPHWGTVLGIPPILGAEDSARYRKIFALQETGRWKAADRLIARIEDRILIGHVLAQRYLHPTRYRSRYRELHDWLARYADHPDAKRIHDLALKRKPKGAGNPATPRSYYGADVFAALPRSEEPARRKVRRAVRGRAERGIRRTIRSLVRRERLTAAEEYLRSPRVRRTLSPAARDRARAIVAAGWFRWGKAERALALAAEAARRSGAKAPAAHWWAGMAAFKLRRYTEAARFFEAAASAPGIGPEEVSRAAFWAARAHLVGRSPSQVNAWLTRAAANPRTFYGLVAGHVLGYPPNFNWDAPAIAEQQIAALMASPPGKRALALTQVGEGRRARRELRPLALSTEPQHLRTMAALAVAARMPSAAFRAARLLRALTGERIDAALYPLPPWTPEDGYFMDRALVFALARQESGFNERAMSRRGARGLLQLMPATARYMSRRTATFRGHRRRQLFDPQLNLALGQKYMDYLLSGDTVAGNMIMMFAAYNGGPGNTRKWQREVRHGADPLVFIESIPVRETRLFVKRSLENFWIYRMRLNQEVPSLTALAGGRWPHYVALDGASAN